jgi:hypothetical protein
MNLTDCLHVFLRIGTGIHLVSRKVGIERPKPTGHRGAAPTSMRRATTELTLDHGDKGILVVIQVSIISASLFTFAVPGTRHRADLLDGNLTRNHAR